MNKYLFRIFKKGHHINGKGNIAENEPLLSKPAVMHGKHEIKQSDFVEALIKHYPANLRGKTGEEAAQKARDRSNKLL